MLDLTTLPLFDAQEALGTALKTRLSPLGVASCIGTPDNMQAEHVWVLGAAEGTPEYEETSDDPSGDTFTLEVRVLCTFAAEVFAGTAARFKTLLAAVSGALADPAFLGVAVRQMRVTKWRVDEGRSADGSRQLGLQLTIECETWD